MNEYSPESAAKPVEEESTGESCSAVKEFEIVNAELVEKIGTATVDEKGELHGLETPPAKLPAITGTQSDNKSAAILALPPQRPFVFHLKPGRSFFPVMHSVKVILLRMHGLCSGR